MTTAIPARAKSATPTATSRQAASGVQVAAPSRREFLFYIWGASIALILGEVGAITVWFMFPRFKEGEFGGTFSFNPEELPAAGTTPVSVPAGRFHIARTEQGLYTLYGVCTHLGCLPKWVPTNNRFECPCHGSKYELNGQWIEGPAPRGLDRFIATITYADGESVTTPANGGPIPLDAGRQITSVRINTGSRILGPGQGVDIDV